MKNKPRYTVQQLQDMAITREDKLKVSIISERHRNPSALLITTAFNHNTSENHVSGVYCNYLRGRMVWFECEDQQLRGLYAGNLSDQQIAIKMNTTTESVRGRRKKLGLTKHSKVLDEELFIYKIQQCINRKLSRKEAAKELGVHEATVGNYCRKHGLSFRKYGSDNHRSKVNSYDRALICTLADLKYLPEHIAKVVDHDSQTIRSVIYDTPSIEHVDLTKNARAMKLLNCEIDGGQYLTPAEAELFESQGLDAYMKKTGSSEAAAMRAFVYGKHTRKFQQFSYTN